MARWLVKSEPFKYSWEQLNKDGQTAWDGVRNNQAAAIFLSSDSLNALSHSAAMYSFLSGL